MQVGHVVPEVTIPPEITPEHVTTSIVDTSCESYPLHAWSKTNMIANPRSRPHLLSQLTRAHVICLVYSISEPSSFDRVAEYWLPLFRREGVNVPVILVGNKIDLRGGEVTNQGLEDEIAPIMREFKVCLVPITTADIDRRSRLSSNALLCYRSAYRRCFTLLKRPSYIRQHRYTTRGSIR